MQKIDEVLISLLLRHSCVIIPNFGGFVAKSCSAKLDLERGVFLPPSKQLLFNKNLINNDGLLISEYASINSFEYAKSQSEIENFVASTKNKLNQKQSVHLERIGTLSTDFEGNIVFEQDRYFNLLLSSYGLSQVQFVANKELEIEVPLVEEKKKKEKAPIRKLNYLKYAAAACLLPLAFYSFWIPTHSDVLESGLISYKDFNPFYKKENGDYSKKNNAIEVKSVLEEKIVFEEKIVPKRRHIGIYEFDNETNIIVYLKTSEKSQKETEVQNTLLENEIENPNSFEYIVGSYENKKVARDFMSKLKEEGFHSKLKRKRGLILVIIGGAESDEEIQKVIQEANEKGYYGWILKK